jgi:hypothetical protein
MEQPMGQSFGPMGPVSGSFTTTVMVPGAFDSLVKALEGPGLTLPQGAKLEMVVPKLPTYNARSRLSRTGRRVYGAPRLGPDFFTMGGKLERRRVRSRLAAAARRDPATRGPWKFVVDEVKAGPVVETADGVTMNVEMTGRTTP